MTNWEQHEQEAAQAIASAATSDALEDAGLAFEPAAVRLGDVVGARREDVEDEAPTFAQPRVHRGERGAAVGVGLHVQERAERDHC